MPKKLRVISGKEVIKILLKYGFNVTRTKGSHSRLTLEVMDKEILHITIPLHSELRKGTLKGVVSELEKHVSSEHLLQDFYTE
ncbi:MAG: type II toxin-antitoxin system HicA family toxin [Minisyncoccia bacterium]